MLKIYEVDFVRYSGETTAQALAALVDGFAVTTEILTEVGSGGHPVARLTGEAEQIDRLCLKHNYPIDGL